MKQWETLLKDLRFNGILDELIEQSKNQAVNPLLSLTKRKQKPEFYDEFTRSQQIHRPREEISNFLFRNYNKHFQIGSKSVNMIQSLKRSCKHYLTVNMLRRAITSSQAIISECYQPFLKIHLLIEDLLVPQLFTGISPNISGPPSSRNGLPK